MRKLKKTRQKKVLEIIRENVISTQEQLLEHLLNAGYSVTQATVSRDIKEMNLVKLSVEF